MNFIMKKWEHVNRVSMDPFTKLALVCEDDKVVQLSDEEQEHESCDDANHEKVK